MQSSYRSHYRRMLPRLLETLEFRSNNAMHQPLIRALALLKQYLQSRLRTYPVEEEVPRWRRPGRVARRCPDHRSPGPHGLAVSPTRCVCYKPCATSSAAKNSGSWCRPLPEP